jgi:hypothetical protein
MEEKTSFNQQQNLLNVLAVVEYLKSRGWKIKKSTAYQHVKDKSLQRQANGTFSINDVENYAVRCLKRLDGASAKKSIDDMHTRKFIADVAAAEYEARIKKKKAEAIEGKYVDREIFEDELATQALAFRNALHTFIHSQAEEIVNFVGGDISKIPDLIELLIVRADHHFYKEAEKLEAMSIVDIDRELLKSQTDENDQDENIVDD